MKYVTVDAGNETGSDKIVLLRQANNVAKYCARKVANSQDLKKNMVYAVLCAFVMVACATGDKKTILRCTRMARDFSM